jgi:hypothetical protein
MNRINQSIDWADVRFIYCITLIVLPESSVEQLKPTLGSEQKALSLHHICHYFREYGESSREEYQKERKGGRNEE